MSELQPDGIVIDDEMIGQPAKVSEPDTPPEDDPEQGSASAPDDTDKGRAVEFTEDQQRYIEETIIAKKVFKLREAERRAEQLQKQFDELQKKLPQDTRPDVPELPDPYSLTDLQFRDALTKREDALRKAAEYDAKARFNQERVEQDQMRKQHEKHEALLNQVQTYSQRATKLGITPEELQLAGSTLDQFGIGQPDNPLTELILQDDAGPLITMYLSKNVSELEELRSLPPTYAAVRIATEIKRKASALKRKLSSTPEPIDPPRSGGSAPKKFGPDGATFE